jgi:hypothetical protein
MAFKHYKQISKQDIPSMKVENVEAYLIIRSETGATSMPK